ncbi:MAG: PspC domain-containing protein [Bacteroidia bacterium]
MNKTLTVNIGGIVFHIEEHAYDALKKYLESIKVHFTMSDGRDEIMQDIEARIAEMLQERISGSKQVIDEDDVTVVVNAMGKPEQFDDGDAKSSDTKSTAGTSSSIANDATAWMGKRRLYRDTEDRVLGGVCSGIGHRLGIDPIWIRLIFFALIWGGGISIWIYILLLIIIPKAETNAQKLEMRGEAVNLSNLAKEFQSDAPATTRTKSTINRIFDTIGEIFVAILKAVVYFFAAIFGFVGIILLIVLFGLLLATLGVQGLVHPEHLFDTFITPAQQLWCVIALILIIGVPVFLIVYRIIKMIFKIKTTHPWLRASSIVLMVIGWVLGFWMLTNIARDFSEQATRRNNITLIQPLKDTLYIDVLRDTASDDLNWDDNFGIRVGRKWHINGHDKNFYLHDNIQFDVEKADGDKFELVQTISAHGKTQQQAYENASELNYKFEQTDSLLQLSDYYRLPDGERYRGQSVRLVLKVPVGKSIFLGDKTKHILNDIENVTNTWDWEMTNYTWTMTDKGLKCIGCNLKDNNDDDDHDINIDNSSTNIKINKNGIQIATDKDTIISNDVHINVDENGVQINTGDDKKKKNK